jgi:hypothetical protein
MQAEPQDERHDPFSEDDENLFNDIAAFSPRAAGDTRVRPDPSELERLAAARGFDHRGSAGAKPVKEPLKPLQFRWPESEVEAFHRAAFEEFGPKHGAKTALFLKLWRDYQASKS